jgi:glycosyltransferase involved in cell wall biosynthesis
VYPTRDGANIAIDRQWCEFSRHVSHVDIVGQTCVVRYMDGRPVRTNEYPNRSRSKLLSSIRTLALLSHYTKEKFLTPAFKRIAQPHLLNPEYKVVIYSFVSTASLASISSGIPSKQLIYTHNDEMKLFCDMRRYSQNPIRKAVAWISQRWVTKFLKKHQKKFTFIHVSNVDKVGWMRHFPYHRSIVAPLGCDIPDNSFTGHKMTLGGRDANLLFVGSLGVKMNFDAIKYFYEKFLPTITTMISGKVTVRIVGSTPSNDVINFCRKVGFQLFADVSDEELKYVYGLTDFAILPFSYSTGTKLKLLNALAHGVPVLMTSVVGGGLDSSDELYLVSDDPNAWGDRIARVKERGITLEERIKLVSLAQCWSWGELARKLYESEFQSHINYPE